MLTPAGGVGVEQGVPCLHVRKGRWPSFVWSHIQPEVQMPIVKTAVRIVVVVGSFAALTGCFSISKRAWANGEAMSQSRAYREVMSGNTSFEVRRQLQSTLNPRRLNYAEVQYPAFGRWW